MLFSNLSQLRRSRDILSSARKSVGAGLALLAASILSVGSASAQAAGGPCLDVHDFGGPYTFSNGSGTDGNYITGMVTDNLGDKFVLTTFGGAHNYGELSEVTAGGQYVDLHDFTGETNTSGLTIDSNGNLYGMCEYGGGYNHSGTFWRFTRAGVFNDLHSFGGTTTNANGVSGPDGTEPENLVTDSQGNVFGSCIAGGANSAGMIFEYTTKGVYKDVYDYGQTIVRADGTTGPDGGNPVLCTTDSSGNVYGTTYAFGYQAPPGSVWKLTPTGSYTELHDFGEMYTNPAGSQQLDGATPGPVVIDSSGNLYGTCGSDGTTDQYGDTNGMIWEIPSGGAYKQIHDFTNVDSPEALVLDGSGNLFGGAGNGSDTYVWELTKTGTYNNLYELGNFPVPGGKINEVGTPFVVAFDSTGLLYGVCPRGTYDVYPDYGGMLFSLAVGPYLNLLETSSPSVVSGNSATGTISIELPNPTDLVVELTSTNSYVTVPATVTIPAGTLSATFPITTAEAATDETATITAAASGYQLSTTFTASRIAVSAITADSPEVVSGTQFGGTVTLNGPALPGGLTITLGSDNPQVTPVTPTVTVPAGQTSVRFSYATTGTTSNTGMRISATDDGSTFVYEQIYLIRDQITSLTITPTEAAGTTVFNATATLAGIAPTGGFPITIASSSSAATTPTTVTVPSGQTSVTFQVPTSVVTTKTAVTLTGTTTQDVYNSTSQTVNFTIDPPPTITSVAVSPGEGVSGSTFTGTVTLNEGATPGGISVAISSNSSYVSAPSSVTIPAGATSITFPVATTAVSKSISVLLRGTVTLGAPAPYPVSVALATNSPFVSIPAIVNVPTGSTTATYSIKTQVIYNTIPVLLKATLGSTTKTVYVTLDATPVPITLSSLTVSPGEAAGGTTFTATATLTGPAPAGGITVAIATNSPFVSPPATVTIPAGSTSVSFTVPSSVVSKSVSALLKATYGSTAKTVYVTLDP